MGVEIERQWIARKGAGFDTARRVATRVSAISQYYVHVTRFEETRYRKVTAVVDGKDVHFYRKAIKKGAGMSRFETEIAITAREYEYNKAFMTAGSVEIHKTRYRVPATVHGIDSSLVMEINEYSSPPLPGMVTVEIEFKSVEEASSFSFPAGTNDLFSIVTEVTLDETWKNKNVALHGFPEVVGNDS